MCALPILENSRPSLSLARLPVSFAAAVLVLALSACGSGEKGQTAPIGLGTVGVGAAGAVGGAVIGKNPAIMVGGAIIGGLLGNEFIDKPAAQSRRRRAEAVHASQQYQEQRRQEARERKSEQEEEEVRREAQQQRLQQQWQEEQMRLAENRDWVDVSSAQRLLAAHGHYEGPIDGANSPETQAAVRRYQAEHGLPQSGELSPELMQQMRASL